jgi:HK97 family phage prohead protease
MKQIEFKGADQQDILDVDMDKRTVKAVWARFGNVDLDNDIIIPEAVTKTIKERGPKGKNLIWSLVDHRSCMENVIGKPSELYVQGDQLIAVTKMIETEMGEDVIKLYNAGLINQHSIGFSTIKSDWQDQKQTVRVIKELKLYEGSVVLWAANPDTPMIDLKGYVPNAKKLSDRLESLMVSFKHGTFTDETFSLIEIEIKQIQQAIEKLTPPVKTVEPNEEAMLKAIKNFNNQFI